MKSKGIYTREIHIDRLRKMLKAKDKPCGHCPAASRYSQNCQWSDMWVDDPYPCDICRETIGLIVYKDGCRPCPCHELDEGEAIRRAELLVEED